MLNFILAQSSAIPEPLTGWLGVVLQAGAFGLVCYIVIFAAPKWFSEFRAEREAIASQAREERIKRDELFEKIITAMQEKFEIRNAALTRGIAEQTTALTSALQESTARTTLAIDASADKTSHAVEASADKTAKAMQEVCHAESVRDRSGPGGGRK